MSRGGRGASKSGVNLLANALNIQRNEISGPPIIQAPPLFPVRSTFRFVSFLKS